MLWFKRKSSKQSQWQKTAELERERLKNVIENVPMILWAVDAHGVFTLSEGKALAQFHSKPGEVVGKLHSEVHRERPHLVANLKKALNGEAFITEVAIDNYWMETTYRPIINKKGTVEGVVGISVDITERKRSQEAVKESEKRHRLATKATKDIVWDWDLMSDEVIWGEALHAEFLYPKSFEQTNSAWWLENIHPDDRTAIHLSIVQCLENKLEHWSGEYRFRKFDGTYANVLDRGFIIYDSSGQPVRMIGAIQDTTERKKYVASLQQSENYFRELVDAAPAMIWIVDENFKCTYLSKSWYEFIGSQAHEDCHIAWLEYVHPEDQELTTLKFKDACHLRKAFRATYRLKNKNGFYRWVLDSGLPRFDKEGNFQGYMGSIIDIHEGKLAEEAVRQSQERFERVTNATNLGVWYCDLPSNFLSWNPKCKEHFWLSAEENVNSEIFLQRLHPDDRNRVLDACHQSIFNGVPYNIEYRTTSPHNPSQFKWIRAVGWTDYNHEGKAIRFDGITLDITIEKQLKDELNSAIQARDDFLSIASHELKSPLTTIKLQAQIMRKNISVKKPEALAPEKINRMIEQTDKSVERLNRLVDDMLDISRLSTGMLTLKPTHTDLSQIIKEVAERLQPLLTQAHCLLEVEAPEGIICFLDHFRMEQVITNLLTNAARYGAEKPVKVKVSHNLNSQKATISVKDFGRGIAKEDQDRIFHRFERGSSSREVSGLGLGLYIARQIVEMHGGSISVKSEVGEGAEFRVSLPINSAFASSSYTDIQSQKTSQD